MAFADVRYDPTVTLRGRAAGKLSIICDRGGRVLPPLSCAYPDYPSARPSTHTTGAAAASGRATPAVKWTKREG